MLKLLCWKAFSTSLCFCMCIHVETCGLDLLILFVVSCTTVGYSYLGILSSYSAYVGRMRPLPDWISEGAILGLQGGSNVVMSALGEVKELVGDLTDVTAVWLQDWTGQRNYSGKGQLPRLGLWWNWEVSR